MKVFGLNTRSDLVFWNSWTIDMVNEIVRKGFFEYIEVFRNAMLGNNGYSYLEDYYDWFVDPFTSDEDKLTEFYKFAQGCIKNKKKGEKKELSIVDMTDESNEKQNTSNCVSDLVLSTVENGYEEFINNEELIQAVEQLEDARDYILEVEGVDIFKLILHASQKLRGTSQLHKRAVDMLKETIAKYTMTDLFFSVMRIDGAIDYIEQRASAAC